MRKLLLTWKSSLLFALLAVAAVSPLRASVKNVMCLKTNTGQYFPVVRVSMMVVADGQNTFEIVLKDGRGEANVKEVTFEKHDEEIDFSLYTGTGGGDVAPDMTKKIHLVTNTGKYFTFSTLPLLTAKEGTEQFDVTVGDVVEANVTKVHFYRGDVDETGILRLPVEQEERLTLQTPVHSQMTVSGCGSASEAMVYSMGGLKVAEAAVENGVTTLQVEHLPAGTYVVKVGRKTLKFVKK